MNLLKIYRNINFKKINKINNNTEVILKILKLRNSSRVRENMYNNQIINKKNHFKWVKNLITSKEKEIYIINYYNQYFGTAIITNYSSRNKRCDWAFYVKKNNILSFGFLVEFKFLNYLFEKKKINKLNCEVLEFNNSVLKLHKKFGFIQEGIKTQHIYRNKKYINTVLLGLDRSNWSKKKLELGKIIFR